MLQVEHIYTGLTGSAVSGSSSNSTSCCNYLLTILKQKLTTNKESKNKCISCRKIWRDKLISQQINKALGEEMNLFFLGLQLPPQYLHLLILLLEMLIFIFFILQLTEERRWAEIRWGNVCFSKKEKSHLGKVLVNRSHTINYCNNQQIIVCISNLMVCIKLLTVVRYFCRHISDIGSFTLK